MVIKNIKRWDPSWGWDNQIYHLATFFDKKNTPFFNNKVHLVKGNKIVLSSTKDYRVCAGSFYKEFYFGSISYLTEEEKTPSTFCLDQSVVVYNKNFQLLNEFRPSVKIKNPSENFTCKKDSNNKFIFGFRDPSIMPNGNIAVCTGGWRWGTPGNICEIKYKHNEFTILRESILDEKLKVFSEIERCTFWNEYMFFSVRGALTSIQEPNKIQVAKLNKNGLYSYYGEVENSSRVYGVCLNEKLQLLFWYPLKFQINSPSKQNLFFENSIWILKEENKIKHFFYRKSFIEKNKQRINNIIPKLISKLKIKILKKKY